MLLGLVGGPIMPLSQMLLLRVFPKEKATLATVLWAMTTLVGPVAGPILGGIICDLIGWPWIFFIKVPVAAAGGLVAVLPAARAARPDSARPIDKVGLGLLVVWVGALQIMLDEGRNKDWFDSPEICVLGVIAAIGFVAFLIWELTEANPIVESAHLPPSRLRRRRDHLCGRLRRLLRQHRHSAALAADEHGLHRDLGGLRHRHHGHLRGGAAPLVGKAVETGSTRG